MAMIDDEVKSCIDRAVLCWLATSSPDNEPNVSPKEVFTYKDDETLLIAHIASPQSISNIKVNNKVCVSCIEIFVQKGFKLKGFARVIEKNDDAYTEAVRPLQALVSTDFPILAVIEVKVKKVERIMAPSYFLFPDRSEVSRIESAMQAYHVRPA